MIGLALAASVATQAVCPNADLRGELMTAHEAVRRAHLSGDAALLASGSAAEVVMADNGAVRTQTRADIAARFATYFQRVRYSQFRDLSPPVVTISPDGQMGWMAVAVEAHTTRIDRPAEPERTFKTSWIATYRREGCAWRMTGMASSVVG